MERVGWGGGVGILNEVLLVRRGAHTDPSYGGVGLKVRELIHHAVSCCSGVPNLSVCERPEQRADKYMEIEVGMYVRDVRQSNLQLLQQFKKIHHDLPC